MTKEKETSLEWKEGWDAYWQAKTLAQNPYFGAKSDDWIDGYSAAFNEGEEDRINFPLDFIDD